MIDGDIKITQLVGPVKLIPVFKANPQGDRQQIEELLVKTLPFAMSIVLARIQALNDPQKLTHYSDSGWPCELVFRS